MPSLSCPSRLVAAFAFLAVVTLSTISRGDEGECEIGRDDVGLAFVWGDQDCRHNLTADLRYGFYASSATRSWHTLVGGELGFLERVGDTRWQIGPVLALGGSGQSHDWAESFDEFYLSPRFRARMWMLDGWMTFEGAVGPSILWTQGPRGDWIDRVGGYVEVGPTFKGVAGFYVGTGYTPPGGHELAPLPGDWRHTFGIRLNLTFSAIVAATMGVVYACAESASGCR